MTARGLRNNNPLNIEKGDEWQGLAADQPDSRFCTFQSPAYGFRVAAIILRNYQRNHGCNTIRDMVNRWAPPGENDTASYVRAVAHDCGVDPDALYLLDAISDPQLRLLLRAMATHENGECPYADAVIDEGITLARKR